MAELLHLAWPFRLGATTVENTTEELKASAAVIACTPRGWRDDDPSFGVTSPLFDSQPVDTQRLAAELPESDPRLAPLVEELIDLNAPATALIGVDITGGSRRA